MTEFLYCIECESMEPIGVDVYGARVHFMDVDAACEGPFAACPPPEVTEDMWDAMLAAADHGDDTASMTEEYL
jgi:hypothetical protein